MTGADPLAELLGQRGFVPLGGLSNRVFLHRARGEVLKLAVSEDPIPFPYRIAGFRACREASHLYAPKGLMPEVLEMGEDFAGAGYPYLRERFIPGRVLTAAYLDNPALWERRLPDEIVRIYRALLDSPPRDLATFWDERIEALDELRDSPHFSRFGDFHAACREAVFSLRERCATGYRLHGDLQFGNLIATGDGGPDARVMLLDWELTAVLPLALEFAHFYAFLHDPVPQVEDHLKQEYARIRPRGASGPCSPPACAPSSASGGTICAMPCPPHRLALLAGPRAAGRSRRRCGLLGAETAPGGQRGKLPPAALARVTTSLPRYAATGDSATVLRCLSPPGGWHAKC